MRLLFPALLGCALLNAQFRNLVTNDDGSLLYFSSSLRMRGSIQLAHPKLFVLDTTGLRLYMQREIERTTSPDATWPVSTYYSLEAVALNGSGSTVAVIARRDCYGGSGCLPTPKYHSELDGTEFRGRMSLSRDGRWALLGGDGSLVSAAAFIDLRTGDRRTWLTSPAWPPRYGRRHVSSGGTAVLPDGRDLRLIRTDGESRLALPETASDAVIDDAAAIVVYETERGLAVADLRTGATRDIGLRSGTGPMQPCLSSDGEVVLFIDAPGGQAQLFVADTNGARPRALTGEPSGIREAVLSGDGRVAYATTGSGRLLRIDVESGVAAELIGQTPALQPPSQYGTPGSALVLRGRGLARAAASAAPPLPLELNGAQLLLDGLPVPLQSVEPERIVFQIPWETAPGVHTLDIRTDASPFFEVEPVEFSIDRAVLPEFERLPPASGVSVSLDPYALAARADFSSLVTRAAPARPGEILHLYMTGLGPVDQPVATGDPAPADPPARLVAPLLCAFAPLLVTNTEAPAEVLFAGLAPGFAGYYQVTIRVPDSVPTSFGDALLLCRPEGAGSGGGAWLPMETLPP